MSPKNSNNRSRHQQKTQQRPVTQHRQQQLSRRHHDANAFQASFAVAESQHIPAALPPLGPPVHTLCPSISNVIMQAINEPAHPQQTIQQQLQTRQH
jgi:hypothetical protein